MKIDVWIGCLVLMSVGVCVAQGKDAAQRPDPRRALVSVERLWDRAEHQAFTDIARFAGEFYVAFREGERHAVGRDGVIRVLRSKDGADWRSVAVLDDEGVDLRDPKLSVAADGRLMVVMGGSRYDGSQLRSRQPKVAFTKDGLVWGPCRDIQIDPAICTSDDWLWRVTWHEGLGYGVVYQATSERWGLHLVVSSDGVTYEKVHSYRIEGAPNETTLRFGADGEMIALVRREAGDHHAMVGTALAPYTDWHWAKLPVAVGGPNFVILRGGELLAAGREYAEKRAYTTIALMTTGGDWKPLLRLPSNGDTSYPGMLVDGDRLWFSYYSGHEGKTSIYLARLRLKNLLAE